MTESEWWAAAPTWARYHTWDELGKTWWATKPTCVDGRWFYQGLFDTPAPEHLWYDQTPCPVEIDPDTTLRKRPKGDNNA